MTADRVNTAQAEETLPIFASPGPGQERQTCCPWCMEGAGWCRSTGGTTPCEGDGERLSAMRQYNFAPVIVVRAGRQS